MRAFLLLSASVLVVSCKDPPLMEIPDHNEFRQQKEEDLAVLDELIREGKAGKWPTGKKERSHDSNNRRTAMRYSH